MNHSKLTLTALATALVICGLMTVSTKSHAAKVNLPIGGKVNGVRDGFFRPSAGNPTTTYSVGPTTMRDVTSTGTDVTVSRETPFGFKSKYGPQLTGAVIDAIKMPKPTMAGFAKGLFRGGLWGLGLSLAAEGLVQLGNNYFGDDKNNFGKQDYSLPPGSELKDYVYWQWVGYPSSMRESESSPWLPAQVPYPTCYKKLYDSSNMIMNILKSEEFPPVMGTADYVCQYDSYYPNGAVSYSNGSWLAQNKDKPRFTDFKFKPFTDAEWLAATTNFVDKNPKQLVDAIAASGQPMEHEVVDDSHAFKSPMASTPVEIGRSVTTEPDGSTKTVVTTGQTTLTMSPQGQINVQDTELTTTETVTPDGTKSTTTTETKTNSSPNVQTEPDLDLPSDPAMPEVPELYKQKYKDGLKGVWDSKKEQLMDSQFIKSIKSLAPNGMSTGTCPRWTLGFDMGFANYGNQELPFPCWLVPFLKAVVMLTAAFTSRKIIWG